MVLLIEKKCSFILVNKMVIFADIVSIQMYIFLNLYRNQLY